MFLPFCFPHHPNARRDYRRYKLEFLKASRDALETRLAAVNAAISTMEQQVAQSDSAEGASS